MREKRKPAQKEIEDPTNPELDTMLSELNRTVRLRKYKK